MRVPLGYVTVAIFRQSGGPEEETTVIIRLMCPAGRWKETRMSRVFEIADSYVDQIAALEPLAATSMGIPGHERKMPDLSPAGPARVAELNRKTSAALTKAPTEGEPARIAQEVMLERLAIQLDLYEAQEYMRALRIIASPLQGVRRVFDQIPK